MPRTIQLAAALPAPPERLFAMYLDPAQHGAFTGAAVEVAPVAGAPFRAFDGLITGTILQVVPERLIVQSWRSPHWGESDIDSTLVLTFLPEEGGARIELVQVNVVEHDFAGVCDGWQRHYWTPWREYLARDGA